MQRCIQEEDEAMFTILVVVVVFVVFVVVATRVLRAIYFALYLTDDDGDGFRRDEKYAEFHSICARSKRTTMS